MRKKLAGLLIIMLIFMCNPFTERAEALTQLPVPPISLPAGTDIDALTTTRYDTPWWVQYHMTPQEQAAIGYKGGEASQMVYAMAVSQVNPQHLLMGTDTSGIWKSEDGGVTWKSSNDGFGLMGTMDIVFDPDNEQIAYAAASPHSANNIMQESNLAGIWKSTDGGTSWKQVLSTSFYRKSSNKLIRFGGIESNGNRAIYVASHSKGVFKSIGNGEKETWTNIGLIDQAINDLFVDATSGTVMAATYGSGIQVSLNDGATWVAKNTGFSGLEAASISENPTNPNHWFAIADGKVYTSTDAGSSWTDLQVPRLDVPTDGKFTKLLFGAPDAYGHPRLYLSIRNSQYSLRYSTDLGVTWQASTVNNGTAFMKDNWGWFSEAFTTHPTNPNIVWVPLDNEIYKSKDGGVSLYPSSSGFSGLRASGFLFDPTDNHNIYITAIDRGLVRSNVYGTEQYPMFQYLMDDRYEPRYGGHRTVHAIARDPQDSEHLFINIGDWGSHTILSESHDDGLNFTQIPGTGMTSKARVIMYHPQNNNIIYAGKNKSIDGGLTWSQLDKGVAAVSPFDGDVVWSADGGVISKSTNGGSPSSWVTMTSSISGIQSIVPDLFVADRLWIGSYVSGLYRLDGSTLTSINESNGLVKSLSGTLPIFDIAQDPNNQLHLIAGGTDNQGLTPSAGLFESLDGGQNWRVVEGLKGTKDIWKVAFHPNLPRVYVGTSSGTWVYEYDKYYDRNLYSDHFQDGDSTGWTSSLGTWNVVSEGSKVLSIPSTDGQIAAGTSSWANYSVQAKVKMTGQGYGGTGASLLFRYQDANNMYAVQLNKADGQIKVLKKQAGTWTTVGTPVTQQFEWNQWYTVKVIVNGSSIICYLDGTEKINMTDTTFSTGKIGFKAYNIASVYDDVSVKDLAGANLFSDNFDDGDSVGWTQVLGTWSIITDGINKLLAANSNSGEYVISTGNTSWANYAVQSRIKMTSEGSGSSGAGLVFRYQNGNNMYYFQLNRASNQLKILKKQSGTWTTLGTVSQTLSLDTWYLAKILINGSSIKGYLNGEEKISLTDTALGNGAIGFRSYNTSALFDDMLVTMYVPVTGVTVSAMNPTLDTVTNNVYHLQASVFPLEANNKKVVWSTSNPTVATVDQSGNVTALSAGSATITVTTVEGGLQANSLILVDTP
ncbi:family 16 glycoside hydrolase [Paenibacillus oryzisoli]|uniref:BIG2 domain-containing protein n=1 Tax=Paenibacillus oryzisoli TaxID=1850517 RepID=A0A198AJH3_9BACL|nr:family 16 glycoside hydrolase [Paenibacillus oryzisoli]OAS21225.1 hypothetical protein A8708_30560 [Paenibacillus oryzisoli]